MTQHPDQASPSNMVTKGNLDDRLNAIRERMDGHSTLDDERWAAHKESHAVVEQSLRDYKRDANEWRASLADLRLTFIPRAEVQSEQRALEAKLHGEVQALATLLSTLDARATVNRDDIKSLATDLRAVSATTVVERDARRGLLSDGRSVFLLIIATIGVLLAILDRLPK